MTLLRAVFFALLFCCSTAFAEQMVRVRLLANQPEIYVSAEQLSIRGIEKNFQEIAIPKITQLKISRVNLNGKYVWKITQNGLSKIQSNPLIFIDGKSLQHLAMKLPNKVILYASKSRIDVIGVVPLQEYLLGVLSSEMPRNWPLETLKAQAVAARSYTLAVMRERNQKIFHLESSIMDQVFRHILEDDNFHQQYRRAWQAVQETDGIVLLDKNGEPLKAYYHSDCGGKTVDAKSVWGQKSELISVTDSSCPSNPSAHWKLSLSKEYVYAKISESLKISKSDKIENIDFVTDEKTQRVESILIALANKTFKMSGNDFRSSIGFQNLRSTLFSVQKKTAEFVFSGRGYGHGVGLCQWGSRMLGKQGLTASDILRHYYPQAKLEVKNYARREDCNRTEDHQVESAHRNCHKLLL